MTLILRTGIETPQAYSPAAAARLLHVTVGTERRIERAAVRRLQTAAHRRSCGSRPALFQVPAGNSLVPANAALPSPVAPAPAQPPPAIAVSRALVSAIRDGRARLTFTLTPNPADAPLTTITLGLPRGMRFSQSNGRLQAGSVVLESGVRRLKVTAAISRRELTIKLKATRSVLHIKVARSAITFSHRLTRRVRARQVTALLMRISATNVDHATAYLAVQARPT